MFRTALFAAILPALAAHASARWVTEVADGAVNGIHSGKPQLSWQLETLDQPKGGDAFLPSAFLHPLKTPAGFQWTAATPAEHIHHLGLWWPWKFVTVEGGDTTVGNSRMAEAPPL